MLSRSAVSSCLALLLTVLPTAALSVMGGGDVAFAPKGVGKVVFKHEYHVTVKGITCANCHDKTFQMRGEASLYKMDMAILTKGQFCGICHNGIRAFDVKDEKNCKRCHKE